MAEKHSLSRLKDFSGPITKPFIENGRWCGVFIATLVETAKQMSPNKAKNAAYELCVNECLHRKTADHFSKSCRFLAILRRDYPVDFYQVIGEEE
ncbi:MAG: hypothetical protein U9O20_01400 [Patescibacteria group bacterium]|nr:hypothetical protein [Patescibacteria group bacterium]